MTITNKLAIGSVLALFIATPALAQQADWSQQGDYYAPTHTVVAQPTAARMNRAEEGDFYAPVATIMQKPTAQELKQAREGDFYAPMKGE
jgi:hypothetical protein